MKACDPAAVRGQHVLDGGAVRKHDPVPHPESGADAGTVFTTCA